MTTSFDYDEPWDDLNPPTPEVEDHWDYVEEQPYPEPSEEKMEEYEIRKRARIQRQNEY